MVEQEPLVRTEHRGAVAWVIIDSPSNRNALGGAVLAGLVTEVNAALAAPTVRAIVITGSGTSFSSGAHLRDTTEPAVVERLYRDLFRGILNGPKPVVARVNGYCFGGAIGLVSVCDLAVTVDDATFGFPEVRLGVTATLASAVSAPLLRVRDAAELLLRGNRFDGVRAVQVGLVNTSVPRERLDEEISALLDDLLAAGPKALANTKRLIRQIALLSEDAAWDLAFAITAETSNSAEAREGIAAFREKRAPLWPAVGDSDR